MEGECRDTEPGCGSQPLAGDVVGLDLGAVTGEDFVEDAKCGDVEERVDLNDQRVLVQIDPS